MKLMIEHKKVLSKKNVVLTQNQRQDFSSVKRLSNKIDFLFLSMELVMKGDDDVKLCKEQNLKVN